MTLERSVGSGTHVTRSGGGGLSATLQPLPADVQAPTLRQGELPSAGVPIQRPMTLAIEQAATLWSEALASQHGEPNAPTGTGAFLSDQHRAAASCAATGAC